MRYKSFFASLLAHKEAASLLLSFALLFKLSDFNYDNSWFKYAIQAACMLCAWLLCTAKASTLQVLLSPPTPELASQRWQRLPLAAGAVLLVITLTILEFRQPFYFVQEDNHTVFMPIIIHGARALFDEGIFSTWNGYNLLGSATTTYGFYALTYPITYLAYALSRYGLGNEFLTLDIMAWFHLISGYALCVLVLRRLHVRPTIAVTAALCFALTGFNLIAGRSWFYMLPTVTYLPALVLSLVIAKQHPLNLRWLLGTAFAIGLYFHSGNVQMWCYGMQAWGVGMLCVMASKPRGWRMAYPVAIAVAGGIAIALPLALPQLLETGDLPRSQLDVTIAGGLTNLLVPWPLATSAATWGDYMNAGTLYAIGSLFLLLFFLRSALALAAAGRNLLQRSQAFTLYFTAYAAIAFLLALGHQAYVWNWLEPFPPFSRFRMPFRMLPVLAFFTLASGALMAENLLRLRNNKIAEAVFCIVSIILIMFNATQCLASFDMAIDKPYPPLPEAEKQFQAIGFTTKGRIDPITQTRWYGIGSTPTLLLNYPALYQIPVLTGTYIQSPEATKTEYRTAMRLYQKNPYEFYYEYGVTWIFVSKVVGPPPRWTREQMENQRRASPRTIDLTYADAFDVASPYTKPMAYEEASPWLPLPYRIRPNGVDIDIRTLSHYPNQNLIVNFLLMHWMEATTDKGDPLFIRPDAYGRISVDLQSFGDTIHIRYCPPWYKGIIPALLLALACVVLWRKSLQRQ